MVRQYDSCNCISVLLGWRGFWVSVTLTDRLDVLLLTAGSANRTGQEDRTRLKEKPRRRNTDTNPSDAESSESVATWSTEQMKLQMVHDRTATGVTRMLGAAAVMRCGNRMEKLPHCYLSWIVSFKKRGQILDIHSGKKKCPI